MQIFAWLKERNLKEVKLIICGKNGGMLEAISKVFPNAKLPKCIVHFHRNIFSTTPWIRINFITIMLEAIPYQENKKATR